LWVTGPGQHNPPMVYLTGGGHMTSADLIFPADGEPLLVCNPMEREEAARSGLRTKLYTEFPLSTYYDKSGGNSYKSSAYRYKDILKSVGIQSGKIMLCGRVDIAGVIPVLGYLSEIAPEYDVIGYEPGNLLQQAMMLKDESELNRIRLVGEKSMDVVRRLVDYLTTRSLRGECLLDETGDLLTVGTVKAKINAWLTENGLENPEGCIFAIGRDAGIPHSTGSADDVLVLGKSIVFDFYPCEPGGGYFHDFTRTWCLGYAPDEVQHTYDAVHRVFEEVVQSLKPDMPFKNVQTLTCDLFEEIGHPTIQQDPSIIEGYIHSIGHGVGLNIHEMPFAGKNAGENETLSPFTVFTIEPGLYYPSKGLGVRLENTYFTDATGEFHPVVDFPMNLVLPMKTNWQVKRE